MLGRKWKPRYSVRTSLASTSLAEEAEVEQQLMVIDEQRQPSKDDRVKRKIKSKKQNLSTKSESYN